MNPEDKSGSTAILESPKVDVETSNTGLSSSSATVNSFDEARMNSLMQDAGRIMSKKKVTESDLGDLSALAIVNKDLITQSLREGKSVDFVILFLFQAQKKMVLPQVKL